jgi:hypothetical protein
VFRVWLRGVEIHHSWSPVMRCRGFSNKNCFHCVAPHAEERNVAVDIDAGVFLLTLMVKAMAAS